MELETKYGKIKIFAKTLEDEALSQIVQFSNSILGKDSNIRIMPDAHAGAGCVIGTTMKLTDKVCPNLVGVDIGCAIFLAKTDIKFEDRLEELDDVVHKYVPSGHNVHDKIKTFRDFSKMKCWNKLKKDVQQTALYSLGTLGGGNHFIEAYKDGYIAVHSGSRNIGLNVAKYYQKQAEKQVSERMHEIKMKAMQEIEPSQRETWLKENQDKVRIDNSLAYLTGDLMLDYLHDMEIMQEFAKENRREMIKEIVSKMSSRVLSEINSTHNYIDLENMILRKGATSAQKDELLVIPLNMRDGLLVCKGKGNPDWNYSAPHGAGRLYSRSKAKQILSLKEYEESMKGVYSTCINSSTLDEAPFAYKDFNEIIECIEPAVEILDRLIPIYNFKASEERRNHEFSAGK